MNTYLYFSIFYYKEELKKFFFYKKLLNFHRNTFSDTKDIEKGIFRFTPSVLKYAISYNANGGHNLVAQNTYVQYVL